MHTFGLDLALILEKNSEVEMTPRRHLGPEEFQTFSQTRKAIVKKGIHGEEQILLCRLHFDDAQQEQGHDRGIKANGSKGIISRQEQDGQKM